MSDWISAWNRLQQRIAELEAECARLDKSRDYNRRPNGYELNARNELEKENQRLREKAKVFIALYCGSVHEKYWPNGLKELSAAAEGGE